MECWAAEIRQRYLSLEALSETARALIEACAPRVPRLADELAEAKDAGNAMRCFG
jgi:hypothetical protein